MYFLTLDHVNGGRAGYRNENGRSERRSGSTGTQIYRKCKRENYDPSEYQILCMNCNHAKGIYGECPHKSGKDSVMALVELLRKAGVTREQLGVANAKPS
jgi:hypothetical protein